MVLRWCDSLLFATSIRNALHWFGRFEFRKVQPLHFFWEPQYLSQIFPKVVWHFFRLETWAGLIDGKWIGRHQRDPKSFTSKACQRHSPRQSLQDMAQESDSSTPSSSSKSGWKCGALATFATTCNNDSPPFDSLWFKKEKQDTWRSSKVM